MKAFVRSLKERKLSLMLPLGYASGFPFLTIRGTLQTWLKDFGVSTKDITELGWIKYPYSLKFLWAPFFDRFMPPILGRRRGWAIIIQFILSLLLLTLGFLNPTESLAYIGIIALLIAFFGASQDIVLDAYRRDVLKGSELDVGSSLWIAGYRIGMLVAGAGALYFQGAFGLSWGTVYIILSILMLLSAVATWAAPEEKISPNAIPSTFRQAVYEPLKEIFSRKGIIAVIAFIILYKLGDSLASEVSLPFLKELGFTNQDIGKIAKGVGFISALFGAAVGAALMFRFGLRKSLWVFGLLQCVSTLGYYYQSEVGANAMVLTFVIGFENFTSGMASAAFSSYIGRLCNISFIAYQFALYTSLMQIPSITLGLKAGWLAEELGWDLYFILCTALALPGMLLLTIVAPWQETSEKLFGENH
jgi:MFS transporter, PAT family, beta-lactamase induction signal transducer AmpG